MRPQPVEPLIPQPADPRQIVPHAQIPFVGGVGFVFLIMMLSASDVFADPRLIATFAATGIVTAAAFLVPWHRYPHPWLAVIPILDMVIVALLRETLFDYLTGVGVLIVFPVLWLSYMFSAKTLILSVAGAFFVTLFPYVSSGDLPNSSGEFAGLLLLPAIISLIAVAVHLAAVQLRGQAERLREVTEELRASLENATDRETTTRVVFDTVTAGIVYYDPTGRILLSNETAISVLSLAGSPSMSDVTDTPLVFAEDRVTRIPKERQFSWNGLHDGEAHDLATTTRWIGEGEDQRAVQLTAKAVRRTSGELMGTVLISQDVTLLADAIAARDDFLTTVSHELRTPLTSIIGYVEVLEDTIADHTANAAQVAEVASAFEIINRNTDRLLALITDLLTAAAEPVDVTRTSTDISSVVLAAAESARSTAVAGGLVLTVASAPAIVLNIDAPRIRDVMDSLLSNALKFTPPAGTVNVGVQTTDAGARITVRDSGLGMTADDQSHVFDRFFRSPAAKAANVAGVGLGLSMAKLFIERHNGTIEVDSTLGVGTTVTVNLPR